MHKALQASLVLSLGSMFGAIIFSFTNPYLGMLFFAGTMMLILTVAIDSIEDAE